LRYVKIEHKSGKKLQKSVKTIFL